MIGQGDKVLVGLSGGKDSLTMLHVLLELQRRSPVKFEIAAATVDPMTPEYDPSPLKQYMEQLGVRYHLLSKPIIEVCRPTGVPVTCVTVFYVVLHINFSRATHTDGQDVHGRQAPLALLLLLAHEARHALLMHARARLHVPGLGPAFG